MAVGWTAALAVILAAVLMMIWWEAVKMRAAQAIEEMMGVDPKDGVPKLEQIRTLESLGVHLMPEEEKQNFIRSLIPAENEYIAAHPYYGFCILAGSRRALDCIYSVGDRECIYQWNSYEKILEGLKGISGLPVEAVNGTDRYKVSFRLYGREYTWTGKKNRDWMDTGLAGFLNRILDRQEAHKGTAKAKRRFYLDNSHEAPLYLFSDDATAEKLNERTGLRFRLARKIHSQ